MLSHAGLADLAARSYAGPWSGRLAGDLEYDLLPRGDELVVAMRGTDPADALNWLRDLAAWPMWTPGIGLLHSGFASGALAMWARVDPIMRKTGLISYAGHSLGGAMALILAGLHALRRPEQPFRVVAIGAPRTCLASRLSWLLARGVEAVEYARRGDIVPDVPLPPLYRHPIAPVLIGTNAGDVFANHAAAQYVADLRSLEI